MQEYQTRIATVEDAKTVSALLVASYPELMRSAYPERELVPALVHMTQANLTLLASGRFYVAESTDQEVIGCGGWSVERPGDRSVVPGLAHIRHFATHPQWVGRGVGRALYRRCEADARAIGCTAFECYSSLNAEPFYASVGFARVGSLEVSMAPDVIFRSIRMRRTI